jgi:hypothetical protein
VARDRERRFWRETPVQITLADRSSTARARATSGVDDATIKIPDD